MNSSFLKLNPDKTNLIILNSKSNPIDSLPFKLTFNRCNVPPLDSVVSLGVNITNNLELDRFINKKIQACSFHLRNIIHIKDSLPQYTRILLVTNLILSTLDYCNSLLACTTEKDLKPHQRVINKSIRFIFNLRKREHTSPYAFKAHFLPITYRIKFKLCLFGYKIIHAMSPDYLSEEFDLFEPTTSTILRVGYGRDKFMFKPHTIKQQNRSIFSKLILNWNSLPYHIRTVKSLAIFKNNLKTHLFKQAYPQLL